MNTNPSSRTKTVGLRRLISGSLLTICLTVGGIVASATPAEAANSVYGCFSSPNGMDLWSMTAKLQYWTGAGWATVATSQLGPKGAVVPGYSCAGWPVPSGYYFMVVVDHRLNPSSFPWWWGATTGGWFYSGSWGQWYNVGYAVPGDYGAVLFGQVTCYGCL